MIRTILMLLVFVSSASAGMSFVGPSPSCDPNTFGDLDGDGSVLFSDLAILANNFEQEVASHAEGDIDCSGRVNFIDYLILQGNYQQSVFAKSNAVGFGGTGDLEAVVNNDGTIIVKNNTASSIPVGGVEFFSAMGKLVNPTSTPNPFSVPHFNQPTRRTALDLGVPTVAIPANGSVLAEFATYTGNLADVSSDMTFQWFDGAGVHSDAISAVPEPNQFLVILLLCLGVAWTRRLQRG